MELETLINLFLLFIFFVGSAIVRRIQERKKRLAAAPKPAKKKKSLIRIPFLDKIREQLRQAAEELERQAKLAKQEQEGKLDQTVWDDLAEAEPDQADQAPWMVTQDYAPEQYDPEFDFEEKPKPEEAPVMAAVKEKEPLEVRVPETEPGRPAQVHTRLQQAVIWSEILAKPVSLR